MDDRRKVAGAAGRMSAATLLSRVLGYVRDMLFGALFGAGQTMDAYLVAFRIPNLFRELFAEGSMAAAFVPVLTETRAKEGDAAAKDLVQATFGAVLTLVGGLCAAGVIFAPAVVTLIAPGFLDEPEKFRTTVLLTRVIFPFLLFVSLAAVTMGALNTRNVFFVPALAPAVLNLVTISVVMLLVSRVRPPIVSVAAGIAAGGLAQFLIQVPAFLGRGFRLRPRLDFGHPGLRKMLLLVLPVALAMSTNQVNIFVTSILASYLPEGSITHLYYAMRLIQFPIGIFGVAMATAVLPTLSRNAVDGDLDRLRETFSFALRLLFFITLPAMAGLMALRRPIVAVLFGHGKFGPAGIAGTASALFFYSAGIWSMVGMRVVASTFYSMQNTKTPVRVAMIGVGANILLSLGLMGPLGHDGLALSTALASGLQFLLLIALLRRRIGRVDGRRILVSFLRTASASALMGVAAARLFRAFPPAVPGSGGEALQLAATIAGCAVFYLAGSRLLGSEEMDYLIKWRSRRAGGG